MRSSLSSQNSDIHTNWKLELLVAKLSYINMSLPQRLILIAKTNWLQLVLLCFPHYLYLC